MCHEQRAQAQQFGFLLAHNLCVVSIFLVGISYHPIGAQYIDGAAKYRKADKGTALTIWKTADAEVAKLIAKNEAISEWTEADLSLFRTGIFSTVECLIDGKQVPKAKALLSKVEPLFAEDEEFKTRSEELNALMK